ncbi:glutamate dehydrogenase/leucine dehydrogenase [Rhodococcus sp. 27YEA15]|uniref:Glu/Leu/Phe/Val dehydrogenase dimerization domain-containing protein n=1 Tax=Rhodococcus sp. 27YEA15 TaxID=3156259 RepID=UPI003C7C8C62
MKSLLAQFESKAPEIVFEWNDSETTARGWTVINSLRGGAAGGGTRMRRGLDQREVESLAKTMEVKFTVSGPAIGGAKSGIDFDPSDPRKNEVLDRWFRAVMPLLKSYYGTGGDLNVDEMLDVVPATERHGLWHPQEGVVTGHFPRINLDHVRRIGQLRLGVAKPVDDPRYAPTSRGAHSIADLVTGWGVAESVRHYYRIYGGDVTGKRVLVQGWGNVGATAAYYLARAGASIVGIIDRDGGVANTDGFSLAEVTSMFLGRNGNTLNVTDPLPFAELNNTFWGLQADVFLPCAASRLVTREQVERLTNAGLELIASGANVPFADEEIFYGPTYEHADRAVSVIPDFIANCGMARAFALLMQTELELSDDLIFGDVSETVEKALLQCHSKSEDRTLIAANAFEIALAQLL